jgi:hypothetical protein
MLEEDSDPARLILFAGCSRKLEGVDCALGLRHFSESFRSLDQTTSG